MSTCGCKCATGQFITFLHNDILLTDIRSYDQLKFSEINRGPAASMNHKLRAEAVAAGDDDVRGE